MAGRAANGLTEEVTLEFQVGNGRVPGLASVIIPSYNKAPYIKATLDSIAAQSYQDVEIVVVDDASSDESVAVIQAWAAAHPNPLKLLVHQQNHGICRTLNDGLALARGEYIACLAADDRYLPHKLDRHIRILEARPQVSFVCGDARVEDPQGVVLHESFTTTHLEGRFRSGDVFEDLLDVNFIVAPSVTIRASALDMAGPYDEALAYEDYDMWLRLARIGELACSETVDCVYLDTPGSLSKSLGSQIEIGKLIILGKYRKAHGVHNLKIDALALAQARQLARLGTGTGPYSKWLLELARASSLYGGRTYAAQVVVEEIWRTRSALPARFGAKLSQLKSAALRGRRS